jgi:hypothetical protein
MSKPSIEEFWSLDINNELCNFYKSLICSLKVSDDTKRKLSVPFLMQASPGYVNNKERGVFFVGKETQGWGGNVETVGYSYESFLKDSNREYRMMEEQSDFIVNRYKRSSHKNSPFWRAFREIVRVESDEEAVYRPFLWSNIVACDYEGRSFLKNLSTEEENEFIEFSKKKFLGELSILKPKVCLLFTGPKYDYILKKYFDLPEKWQKTDIRSLPECSEPNESALVDVSTFMWENCCFMRTYHPKFLRLQSKWKIVDVVGETVKRML